MRRLLLTVPALATLSLLFVAACSSSTSSDNPTTTPDPTATSEPETALSADISTLLLPSDVSGLTGHDGLTTSQRDQRPAAAVVDPSQVEHIDTFDTLSFTTQDGIQTLLLTVIDFDSEAAATDHAATVMGEESGLSETAERIGDASAFRAGNEANIGSMVVFRTGEWLVTLHTGQAGDAVPIADLEQIMTLAQLVAGRLAR